ncbi:MAG: carboxypeptidase-like regulatory domain-containing protein [Treponema bryantii]|nr:carboxypeptidase-like regulatory domain-containing protein [Treponema bryantii]
MKYLGKESDGEYLVSSVEHTFNVQEGYFTTCHLKRNFCEISNKSGNVSAIDKERADNQTAGTESNVISTGGGSQTEEQNNAEETNDKEKNPAISNPHWEDSNGNTITKALVGDEVYLCADVTDIDDGATAKIKIIEKDDDGNADDIDSVSGKVQDSKIKVKWKVKYTEDNDDTESQKEMDEKGYTLPEYAFTIEYNGLESDKSGQLDVSGGLKVQLKDKKTNELLKNVKISLKQNDSIYKTLTTDENGYFELMEIPIGEYEIVLEN